MSTQVDSRVVSLQFDNAHFEKNVATTVSSLDKLKNSLQLTGATKGLEDVDAASKKVNLGTLGNAVESVGAKFSAMQVMAITALANITNSAVNAGKRIASALTIDPIKTGFSEYETQINSIQTILANTESKGSTLQDVNSALDTLNTYADKTIYNFTEMTRNIGTFTAAGVDLETSVSSIQGIANLAAVSGSTSQQASTAMYQLSQALSSGTVKLMDWNSVVNAGMGGQVFQDALKQTARAHGVAVDDMIKKNGSFRESLQEGWITSEILTETLQQFTMAAEEGSDEWKAYKKELMKSGYTEKQALAILKMANTATDAATKVKTFTQLWDTLKESAQSGWTQTWEIIMGDFGEAKEFLTEVSDTIGGMIGAASDARNKLLSGGLSSGWKQLLGAGIADEEGYKDIFKSVAKEHDVSINKMIKAEKKKDDTLSDSEAFQKALTKGTADGTLTADMFSESVHKMSKKMYKMSAEQLKAAGYTQEHVTQIKKLSKGLKNGSVSMDDFVKKMSRPSGRENIIQSLWNAFDGLMSVINPIKEAFREIFPPITGEQLYKFTEQLKEFTSKLTLSEEQSEKLKSVFKGLFSVLDIVFTLTKEVTAGIFRLFGSFKDVGGSILDTSASLGEWLNKQRKAIKENDIFGKSIDKVVGFLQKVIDKIKTFMSFVKSKIAAPGFEFFINLMKGLWEVLKYLGEKLGIVGKKIAKMTQTIFGASDAEGFLSIFNGGLLAGILLGINKFTSGLSGTFGEIKSCVGGIKEILDSVRGCFEAYQKNLQANTLLKIAAAIAVLAIAITIIASINPERLYTSLNAVAILFGELLGSMAIFNKMANTGKGAGKAATLMIGMSIAVSILAGALRKVADIEPDRLLGAVIAVSALAGVVVVMAKILSKDNKKVMKGATSLVIFAFAIKILAGVCKDLSTLGWEEMGKGLLGVGALLGAVAGFLNIAKFGKKAMSNAVGMVIMAAALKILAGVCKDFSGMKWEDIGKGLLGVGLLLVAVAGFTKLTGNVKNIFATGLALLAMGAAMKIFVSVIKEFAGMSWTDLGKGLLAFGVALVGVAAALKLMPKNAFGLGLGLVVVASALAIMSNVVMNMSGMSWEEIGKGLLVLGSSLGLLALGLLAIKQSSSGVGALLLASIALAIMTPVLKTLGGMSLESIGLALLTLAGAFTVIAIAGHALKPIIGVILKLAGSFVLVGVAVAAIGAGLLMAGIGLSGIAVGVGALVTTILDLISAILSKAKEFILSLCSVIIESAPAIGEAIKAIVIMLIDMIVECIPKIVDGVLKTITQVLGALVEYTPQLVELLFKFVINLINGIADHLPDLIQAGVNLLMAFFTGTIDALKSIDPNILAEGIVALGFLTALVTAMAFISGMIPLAMAGVIGAGVVAAELALVLAAIGKLNQIPGLQELVENGGGLLQAIGTAIGLFIGGLVGGVAAGASATLPAVGTNLADFMKNLNPFITGLANIDPSTLDSAKTLVGVIGAITAVGVMDSITSFLTGSSSITKFASELPMLGMGLSMFSASVAGINTDNVTAAANAAKTLAEMTATIPNEGGVASWFAGENSISKFASELPTLGMGLAMFSMAVSGINPENVTAAANAAKSIAEMCSHIPNEGGVASWFAGENSISKFGQELPMLGMGLAMFSMAVAGINPENVTAAANAAKSIAEMCSHIPNEGGVVSWFAGENSISKFGQELPMLGMGLAMFSMAVAGINPENVTAAANAAKTIAEMTSCIPNEGGVAGWFAGENSISKFGSELSELGMGLLGFSIAANGIIPENITAAANAAKSIAEMASIIPNEGGVAAWFAGDNSISKFANHLPNLGAGLKGFSDSLVGINPTNVLYGAMAGKYLAEMANTAPKNTSKLISFGTNLASFGTKLKEYFTNSSGITEESINTSNKAINAVKKASSIDSSGIKTAATAIKNLVDSLSDLSKITETSTSGFNKTMKTLGKSNADALLKTFTDLEPKMEKAGKGAMSALIKGLKSKNDNLKTACSEAVTAVKEYYEQFKEAGKHVVNGFAKGITEQTWKAEAKAAAMAEAAKEAAKKELDEHSPSKEFYKIGAFAGQGFVNAFADYESTSYKAGSGIAKNAVNGLSDAISKAKYMAENEIDSQPTIRPVLDLSDITSGARSIGNMLDFTSSVGLMSNVRAINSSMRGNQNGANNDIISAIKDLRTSINGMSSTTYQINGITYDDGSNVSNAVGSLIRAAKVQRRI